MKSFRQALKTDILRFDGGYGTVFQANGLQPGQGSEILNFTNPDLVYNVHNSYVEAGAQIIKTNTFGVNPLRYPPEKLREILPGYDNDEDRFNRFVLEPLVLASSAAKCWGRENYVALDIGPCGKMVGKDVTFDEAVEAFSAVVRAGARLCDIVLLETFSDLCELRAAITAVKNHTSHPFVCTFAVGTDGRTFTGSSIEILAKVCTEMGASAVGLNCGTGPDNMLALLPRLLESTHLPVCLNPNAGLPHVDKDGKTFYNLTPESFAETMAEAAKMGATLLGGCCGTTPEHISALTKKVQDLTAVPHKYTQKTEVCSATKIAQIGDSFAVIGERINPTGKPKLKEALRRGDIEYLAGEALTQTANGADILDVNTGLADIDEKSMLTKAVQKIQTVTDLPLQIDTSDPVAMEAALRAYNGLALINSVNGSEKSMSAVFPLAKKYGGTVIGLTLDEKGIPDTPEGRYEIAERIVNRAKDFGIGKNRIIIDPLALTLGADPESANKTLGALKLIKEKLGVKTSLGVSNISFGLPDRESVNRDFLCAAMNAGLDAAIMNPANEGMMLLARNSGSADASAAGEMLKKAVSSSHVEAVDTDTLGGCIYSGLTEKAKSLADEACKKAAPTDVIANEVIPALDRIGTAFEKGKVFLPGLLAAADSAVAAIGVITSHMPAGTENKKGKVVLATVEGDVHDIGKNIVGVMLQSYGFEVIDLGKNVPAAAVVEAVKASGAKLAGLSALMTTTVPSMERTIELMKKECPDVKTVVGGAVLTEGYAAKIGASFYAADAMATVRITEKIYQD